MQYEITAVRKVPPDQVEVSFAIFEDGLDHPGEVGLATQIVVPEATLKPAIIALILERVQLFEEEHTAKQNIEAGRELPHLSGLRGTKGRA